MRTLILTVTASVALTPEYFGAGVEEVLLLCDATSGPMSVTLPDAASIEGKRITVKKIDATANHVTPIGTVDGYVNAALQTPQTGALLLAHNGQFYCIGSITV